MAETASAFTRKGDAIEDDVPILHHRLVVFETIRLAYVRNGYVSEGIFTSTHRNGNSNSMAVRLLPLTRRQTENCVSLRY